VFPYRVTRQTCSFYDCGESFVCHQQDHNVPPVCITNRPIAFGVSKTGNCMLAESTVWWNHVRRKSEWLPCRVRLKGKLNLRLSATPGIRRGGFILPVLGEKEVCILEHWTKFNGLHYTASVKVLQLTNMYQKLEGQFYFTIPPLSWRQENNDCRSKVGYCMWNTENEMCGHMFRQGLLHNDYYINNLTCRHGSLNWRQMTVHRDIFL